MLSLKLYNEQAAYGSATIKGDTLTDPQSQFRSDILGKTFRVERDGDFTVSEIINPNCIRLDGLSVVSPRENVLWTMEEEIPAGIQIGGYGPLTLNIRAEVTEDDTNLKDDTTGLMITLGDGTPPVMAQPVKGPLSTTFSVRYPVGSFMFVAKAYNFRYPVVDSVTKKFEVVSVSRTNLGDALPENAIISGFILPKDAAFPDAKTWNLDRGVDEAVLASSIKMLLLTEIGDRIMTPNYGTRLRKLIFEPQVPEALQTMIASEVSDAVSLWEPRAKFVNIEYTKADSQTVSIQAVFESLLTRKTFGVNLVYRG